MINIHLFHDASNFVAMEAYPSVYCKNRRRALEHTLQRFHNDQNGKAPYFVFGDFNFRTDTESVIKVGMMTHSFHFEGISFYIRIINTAYKCTRHSFCYLCMLYYHEAFLSKRCNSFNFMNDWKISG